MINKPIADRNMLKTFIATVFISLVLTACGGGGSGAGGTTSTTNMVVIQGIVSDDPVEGATVTIMSLPLKEILATAVTDSLGNYTTPPISEDFLSNDYYIKASGGISQGKPFDGEMVAVYGEDSDHSVSHVTLITTAVTKAAEANTSDLLQLHAMTIQIAATGVLRGLLPEQWSDIDVANEYSRENSAQIQRSGVDDFNNEQAARLNYTPVLPPVGTVCEDAFVFSLFDKARLCSVRVGSDGGTLRDQTGTNSGNVIVEIPSSEESECEYIVTAKIVNESQSITVSRQVKNGTQISVTGCKNAKYDDDLARMVIRLPSPDKSDKFQAPDQNGATTHSEMGDYRTKDAKIEPSYFVTDGETHRVSAPDHLAEFKEHRTASNGRVSIVVERKYGANLSRKTGESSGHPDAASVLFIHGFTLGFDDVNDIFRGEAFGGGDGTWGQLPQLVSGLNLTADSTITVIDIERFVPYNFQWRTDASFYDGAKDLAKAIRYAYEQSGNRKIHIIAHSFGGVLARVALQGLYDGANAADTNIDNMVATLTTVGTPHSGTSDKKNVTFSDITDPGYTVNLPVGWDSFLPGNACRQVSCYQTGALTKIEDWMKTLSNLNLSDDAKAGYLIADLKRNRSKLPDGLIFQMLIGQIFTIGGQFSDGDRLISFSGQRLNPASDSDSPANSLLYEERIGGAYVTERVLGVNSTLDNVGFPGMKIDSDQLSEYATHDSKARHGYAHTRYPSNIAFVSNHEVNVPPDCGDSNTCEHDTWVNIKELLLSMHGGPPSPNFESTTSLATFVSSVDCTTPLVGEAMTCTITGSRLPELTLFEASNCSPSPMAVVAGGNDTQRQFTCTPSTVDLLVEVNYLVPGFTGLLPLVPAVVASSRLPVTAVGKLNDTGITPNLCYADGGNTSSAFVSCASAGALALSDSQDGMVGFDVTENDDSDGKAGFSFSLVSKPDNGFYDSSECVMDKRTGLIWESKTDDRGYRDFRNTYNHLPADSFLIGAGIGADEATVEYLNEINLRSLCGFTDWRLPTVAELHSLMDYGKFLFTGAQIDSQWFANTNAERIPDQPSYATSSLSAATAGRPWYVSFSTSHLRIGTYQQFGGVAVRLVRSATSEVDQEPQYLVSSNRLEVIDPINKLVWRRCPEGMMFLSENCVGEVDGFYLNDAFKHANSESSRTGEKWRLPNIKELSSIVDYKSEFPAIDSVLFPATPSSDYWSSTITWIVDFSRGETRRESRLVGRAQVRLVRDLE